MSRTAKEYQDNTRTIEFCEDSCGLWSASLDGYVGKGPTMTEALDALCATLEDV